MSLITYPFRSQTAILRLALPAIVTNITVPLLGLVDTAIVGHMGEARYLAAVAVGTMVFNLIYWVFGFLRMGTSGLTAQARGRRDMDESRRLLLRSLTLSAAIAALLVLLQWPLREVMFLLLGPTADVRPLAEQYYRIVIWGAPPMLALYALTGWLIGMQNTRLPMLISIGQNVANILCSLLLVYVLGMKVEGVALGTVVAQYAGCLIALALLWRHYKRVVHRKTALSLTPTPLSTFFRVNRDIFLRTLCLVAVNLYFTAMGARQGAAILAVNALLMQLLLLFSYVMDGFAYAGEALGGRYWGACNRAAFRQTVHSLFGWGTAMTFLFTAVYVAGGMPFLGLLTNDTTVLRAAAGYVGWAYLIPLSGVAAFIWDGIFIGATLTRAMLMSCAAATAVFFVATLTLMPRWGNHGLWMAMLLYLAIRGGMQTFLFRQSAKARFIGQ